jgi:NAD(P)-dependent dehydrogenase (short-subunit alcohol dehydrogenase family)
MRDAARTVYITGATGSAGRAAARAFAEDGARLGLFGTDRGRLEGLAAALGLADGSWAAGIGDLRDEAAARAAIAGVADRIGPADTLLHLVGGYAGGTPLVDVAPGLLGDMLAAHLWSTFHVARAVVPTMVERGWGRIVAVTSTFAAEPNAGAGPYVAAKAAEEALLRSLARDVAGAGVTVNLLAVKTIDAGHAREREPSKKTAAWTTPEELVEVMRFLCTHAAAAVNGQVIRLDGRG